MLKDSEARATIAVKDLVRARQFYEGTLGLHANEGMGTLVFDSGKSKIVVYKSEFAGTNKATSATIAGCFLQRIRLRRAAFGTGDGCPKFWALNFCSCVVKVVAA